ncbi:MAG: hypothetical protein QW348_01615 [Ignisphaera sp.]
MFVKCIAIVRLEDAISYGKTGPFGGAVITPNNARYHIDSVPVDPQSKS